MKLLAICTLLVLVGCPSKKDSVEEAEIQEMRVLKVKMCACHGLACVSAIQAELTRWQAKILSPNLGRKPRDRQEWGNTLMELGEEYATCAAKAIEEAQGVPPSAVER